MLMDNGQSLIKSGQASLPPEQPDPNDPFASIGGVFVLQTVGGSRKVIPMRRGLLLLLRHRRHPGQAGLLQPLRVKARIRRFRHQFRAHRPQPSTMRSGNR